MRCYHSGWRIRSAGYPIHASPRSARAPLPLPAIIHIICGWNVSPGTLAITRYCMR